MRSVRTVGFEAIVIGIINCDDLLDYYYCRTKTQYSFDFGNVWSSYSFIV